jgi:Carboxypeptidase regulatory-like domain
VLSLLALAAMTTLVAGRSATRAPDHLALQSAALSANKPSASGVSPHHLRGSRITPTRARKGHPPKRTVKHPTQRFLKKAHSRVFDVRKLKGKVVKRERAEVGEPLTEREPSAAAPAAALPKIVTQKEIAAASAPAPGPDSSFDGLDFANWGAGHPPDENGDVGPTYYIQTVNTSIGIYDKSNGTRVAAFTFNAFMSQGNFGNLCDTDNFGDPVVVYDSFENRWFITDFAFKLDASGNVVNPPGAFQCFAVSKTGDPVNGGWNFYSIAAPGALNDYPKFGVWPDAIYMSANMFGYPASGSYQGYHVWAINKQQMYNGDPTVQVVDFAGDTTDFTVIPANARLQTGTPPAGSSEYFVSTEQFLNALSIYKFHVDWDKVSTSTFTGPFTQLQPNCWPNATPASASTPANAADVLAIRAMAQAQYTNLGGAESLWVDHTVQRGVSATNTTCNAPTGGNATIRWYQANVTGGTVAANVVQGQSFDPEGANTFFRFMPSLAVDRAGDMAVGYAKSNATTNPQIKYAGRLVGDPANTLGQAEQTLIDGTGAQSGNCGPSACIRWGDYSGMALDPNGCEFWMTGEYYATTGLNDLTRIGSFHYPSCTTVGNGTLSGSVTDGVSPLAGVTVALGSRTTTTDGSGNYSFTVPAGTYASLSASKAGFDTSSASTIAVPNGGNATRNFTLNAAAQSGCFTDNSQSTFQRGVPSNCDLTSSPGNVVLASPDNTAAKNSTVSPSGFGFNSTSWAGQTFTPTVTGQLKRVDVELFCSGCAGTNPDITLSIRNTTTGTNPVPTGADLATATLPGFNDGAAGGLKTFNFASPITLTAGTRYAFIFRSVTTRTTGVYAYTCSCATTGFSNTNPYANGQRVTSADSGSTWAADTIVGGRDLNFITYINPGFAPLGTFVSSLKDANPAPGRTPNWTTLTFTATTPAGTAVKFQVAGSNNPAGPFNYVGPDGTASTFFMTSGASLSQFNGFRYLRYKAFLSTNNGSVTPTLSSVAVCFTDAAATGATSLAVDPASGTYGGTTNLSATLTSSGVGVAGETVSFTLNGSPVGSGTTDSSGVATVNNVSLSGIDAGSYPGAVAASFTGDSSHDPSSGSNSLTVAKADQAITITTHAPSSAVYNTSFGVAGTGGGSGNPVTFSSSGSCSNTGANFTMTSGTGTCTVKYDQAGNGNYNAAPQVTETVNAQKAAQAITITTHAPSSAVYNSSFSVAATGGGSGNPIVYSSSGGCSNAGSTYTMTSGTIACSVKYDQAGNANYNAAPQVSDLVLAQKANQTITVTTHAPANAVYLTSFGVAANAPGGSVTFSSAGACSNNAASFTMTAGTGTCTVKYDQGGNTNYNAAPQVTETVNAQKADQTITVLTHAPAEAAVNTSFTVAAGGGGSGNPIVYSSGGSCSNTGDTFTMTSGTGTCSVMYDEAGDSNYNAAPQVTDTVAAKKGSQTITVTTHAPASAVYNDNFSVAATGGASGNPVTFSSAGSCSNTGANFTMTSGTGTCTVKYDQAGNDDYTAAPEVTETVNAQKAAQAITVTAHAPASAVFGSGFSVAATGGGSGNPVTFSSAGGCTNSGADFTMTSGTTACSVSYDQAGDSNYNAASQVTETVNAQKADQTITVMTHAPSSAVYLDSFGVAATAPGGTVAFSNGGVCSNNNASFTMTAGTGTCTVKYDQAGNADYNAAPQVTESVNAQKADQTITVLTHAPANAAYNASFTVSAGGGGSGNPIVYSSAGSCSNSGATFTITSGTGTCSVRYDEAGDSNYNAASQVSESVNAQKAGQTISFGPLPDKTYGDPDFTVSATASSGLGVSFAASGQCTVSGSTVHLTGVGSCTITASQAGDGNYSAAADVPQTFQIRSATPPPASKITGASATCSQFADGSASPLASLIYSVRSGKISDVQPRSFVYWVKVTASAGSNTFTINQAITSGNFSTFFSAGSGAVYMSSCGSGPRDSLSQAGDGTVTLRFNAPTAGTYFLAVTYKSTSVKGQRPPNPSTAQYELSTQGVASSTSAINLSPPAGASRTKHVSRFFWRLRH